MVQTITIRVETLQGFQFADPFVMLRRLKNYYTSSLSKHLEETMARTV